MRWITGWQGCQVKRTGRDLPVFFMPGVLANGMGWARLGRGAF